MAVHAQLPHKHRPRGDAAVKKNGQPIEPNIVETYKIGNTTIKIADNYIRTDPKEVEEILNRFYASAWRIVENMSREEEGDGVSADRDPQPAE
jgi:hypothetical protein